MIEKFDGENWHIWKLKIKFILIDKGLWKIVSGRLQKPSGSGVTPEEIERWEDLDERALSCICLHMKDSQLLNVSKAQSSAEAWESLETLYEHKNAASLLFLLRQFFTIKMRYHFGPHQQNSGACRATRINWREGFRPLDDYDVVGEPSRIIPNVGCDIGNKGT